MTTVTVATSSRTYPVTVERGGLRSAGAVLRHAFAKTSKIFVVSTETITRLWGSALRNGLQDAGCPIVELVIPDGESAKRLAVVERLAGKMVKAGGDRHSVVVAFGGGVVGDVGGFLASVFMRGIPVVQVPTTLVAQVDSAIGGKTGVNLVAGKNLVGTFHQPSAVLVDPDVLATLPDREYRSGLFEVMKYGVIRNPEIFTTMESHRGAVLGRETTLLESLIGQCIQVKADVVGADERESGERRILNFGHTVGHTLEAATKFRTFLHGEAVGWGMVAASMIGEGMHVTGRDTAERIVNLVRAYGPLPPVAVGGKQVLKLLLADKKTVGGVPHFVLATDIGKVAIANDVSSDAVLAAVNGISRLSKA